MQNLPKGILEDELNELFDLQDAQAAKQIKENIKPLSDEFETCSEFERKKMIELFKMFGVQHYEFTTAKGFDRIDGYYTGKTGTEYIFEVKTRNNPASAYTYSTIIEKSKLEYILNSSKNIKHKPLVFFFFETGDCWIEHLNHSTYYSGFAAEANKTTADGKQAKVMKDFIPFIITPNKLITIA
jgi:hypothetical protein